MEVLLHGMSWLDPERQCILLSHDLFAGRMRCRGKHAGRELQRSPADATADAAVREILCC